MLSEVKEGGVETALAFAVHVALNDDRLHVVVQDLARHTAECSEGVFMAADQRGHLYVADELDIAGTPVARRGAECTQRRAALAELDQSTCNCSPISVSKRIIGATGNVGRSEA